MTQGFSTLTRLILLQKLSDWGQRSGRTDERSCAVPGEAAVLEQWGNGAGAME